MIIPKKNLVKPSMFSQQNMIKEYKNNVKTVKDCFKQLVSHYEETIDQLKSENSSLKQRLQVRMKEVNDLRKEVKHLQSKKNDIDANVRSEAIQRMVNDWISKEGKHSRTTTSEKKKTPRINWECNKHGAWKKKKTPMVKRESKVTLIDDSYNSDDDSDYTPPPLEEDSDDFSDDLTETEEEKTEPKYMDVREYIESIGVNLNKLSSPRAWKSLVDLGVACKKLATPVKAKKSIMTKTGKVRNNVWVNTYTVDQYRNELKDVVKQFRRTARV